MRVSAAKVTARIPSFEGHCIPKISCIVTRRRLTMPGEVI